MAGGKSNKKGQQAKQAKPAAKGAKPKPAAKAGKKQAAKQPSGGPAQWWQTSVQFLKEVRTELKKVHWPSRKQTISSTMVVVALVAVVSVFLSLVDFFLGRLVRYVIG